MIDPIKMTKYGLSNIKLEETLLFCICVAGKNAVTTANCLDRFLKKCRHILVEKSQPVPKSPFRLILAVSKITSLAPLIRSSGLGCYNQRARSFVAVCNSGLNLKTCGVTELEEVPGIGPKTSRFFLLHTRRNAKIAALDVHILRYMSDHGVSTPKTTPTGRKYLDLEQKFLEMAADSGKSVAAFDLAIWNEYRNRTNAI